MHARARASRTSVVAAHQVEVRPAPREVAGLLGPQVQRDEVPLGRQRPVDGHAARHGRAAVGRDARGEGAAGHAVLLQLALAAALAGEAPGGAGGEGGKGDRVSFGDTRLQASSWPAGT